MKITDGFCYLKMSNCSWGLEQRKTLTLANFVEYRSGKVYKTNDKYGKKRADISPWKFISFDTVKPGTA